MSNQIDRKLGSNLDRPCGTATRFLSNHLVIEISADVIRYKPRLQSRLIPWLSLGIIPLLFPGWIRRTALVQGEIDLKLVNSFQADPGWPILGSPSISIELLDRAQPRKVTFFLQRYLLIPRRAYDGMIGHLRSLGIREENVAPSRGLRSLSWLFVPILIIIGWQVAKGTNGISDLRRGSGCSRLSSGLRKFDRSRLVRFKDSPGPSRSKVNLHCRPKRRLWL